MVRRDDVPDVESDGGAPDMDRELRTRFERLVHEFVGRIEGA